jgi:hypothetical protein
MQLRWAQLGNGKYLTNLFFSVRLQHGRGSWVQPEGILSGFLWYVCSLAESQPGSLSLKIRTTQLKCKESRFPIFYTIKLVGFPDFLQERLTTSTVTPSERRAIFNEMFDIELTEDKYECFAKSFGSYFVHCYDEHYGRGAIAKMSHRQLLDIVELLQEKTATRESIIAMSSA